MRSIRLERLYSLRDRGMTSVGPLTHLRKLPEASILQVSDFPVVDDRFRPLPQAQFGTCLALVK
jgi:hypothetical protein